MREVRGLVKIPDDVLDRQILSELRNSGTVNTSELSFAIHAQFKRVRDRLFALEEQGKVKRVTVEYCGKPVHNWSYLVQ